MNEDIENQALFDEMALSALMDIGLTEDEAELELEDYHNGY